MFAFTAVLGWSHYSSKSMEHLGGHKNVFVYRVIFVPMMMSIAVMTSSLAWVISDTYNGLMIIPDLIGNLAHESIAPMLSFDPAIQKKWKEAKKDSEAS